MGKTPRIRWVLERSRLHSPSEGHKHDTLEKNERLNPTSGGGWKNGRQISFSIGWFLSYTMKLDEAVYTIFKLSFLLHPGHLRNLSTITFLKFWHSPYSNSQSPWCLVAFIIHHPFNTLIFPRLSCGTPTKRQDTTQVENCEDLAFLLRVKLFRLWNSSAIKQFDEAIFMYCLANWQTWMSTNIWSVWGSWMGISWINCNFCLFAVRSDRLGVIDAHANDFEIILATRTQPKVDSEKL